ncbi:MAG: ABC transporter permease [Rhodoglobus sp.]
MTSYTAPTLLQATKLVAEREIRTRLRSKSFVISTLLLMLSVLASIVIGTIVSSNPTPTKVAAVGAAAAAAEGTNLFDVTRVDTLDDGEKLLRNGNVTAVITEGSGGITVIGLDAPPSSVISGMSIAPTVQLLKPEGKNPFLIYIVAIGFGLVFFLSAITFGQVIAQSVVEEKQTRIVEILLAAVPARALLAGKIIGNSILAFGQIIAIALLAGVALLATGQDILLADIGPSLIWFVVLFAAGFVMLASLYAATAALVSRQEDLASALSPVTTLVMLPYILVIVFNNNDLVLGIMSYVPFSAPVGMPMRVFLGTAQWWEPIVALAVLLATTVAITVVGARVYENGLLRTGAKVKLAEALKAN